MSERWRSRPAFRQRTTRAVACRPRPLTDTPLQVPDAITGQLTAHLLDRSGVVDLIEAEIGTRPGPPGVPVRTVLLAVLLDAYYNGKTVLAEAWRLVTFRLAPALQERLGLIPITAGDPHQESASSRRFYRGFDRRRE
ncbi:hypothetical protein [Nonomuraea rhodomycinica]|uniref:Uncharacterized protein n=1 Tax=Nonomuraea rhodomycinica TaxID=1712872 RepID=A0A7Y6MD04_9ACTN|nr:hypothetical protein [Nonomuraea rhodomycinica]NUW43337.1 hypothetical protein [Nonomuraea rhodomycinica]